MDSSHGIAAETTLRELPNTALGTCRPGSKDEDAKKKRTPNDDDAQHGPDLVRDSRPDACVIGLAHASSVVLKNSIRTKKSQNSHGTVAMGSSTGRR